jgi:hypothetical protein
MEAARPPEMLKPTPMAKNGKAVIGLPGVRRDGAYRKRTDGN